MKRKYMCPIIKVLAINHGAAILQSSGSENDHADAKQHDLKWKEEVFEEEMDKEDWFPKHKNIWKD